jgi:hypothetical protein
LKRLDGRFEIPDFRFVRGRGADWTGQWLVVSGQWLGSLLRDNSRFEISEALLFRLARVERLEIQGKTRNRIDNQRLIFLEELEGTGTGNRE